MRRIHNNIKNHLTMQLIAKTVILMMAFFISIFSSTQASARNLRWGAEGGVDISTPVNETRSAGVGFHVGLRAEYKFTSASKGWYLSAGLGLASKPWKSTENEIYDFIESPDGTWTGVPAGSERYDATPYYLQIPVMGGYRFPIGKKISLLVETGPYFAAGIFGKMKTTTSHEGRSHEFKDNCFSGFYNTLDCGWGLNLGLRVYDRFIISAGTKMQFNSFDASYDNHNITYGLSVAYMF